MAILGGWGPGWFVDPCDVRISLDDSPTPGSGPSSGPGPGRGPPLLRDAGAGGDGEVFSDPWYAYDGSMSLFCGRDAVVSGAVTVTTSTGAQVQHLGIKVIIEEYIHFMDPYVPTRLKYICDTISEEGYVTGEVTYPFRLPLDKLSEAASQHANSSTVKGEYPNLTHWLNSYNGNSFAIRHILKVEVYRPWYTFNIYRYKFLSFQGMEKSSNCSAFINTSQVHSHPGSIDTLENGKVSDITKVNEPTESESIVPETILIDGLADTGKCRVSLVSNRINLARSPLGYSRGGEAGDGAIIRGVLQLSDLKETVVSAKCMLIRAEYVGSNNTHDSLECEHLIFGVDDADSVELLEDEVDRHLRLPISKGYVSRQDVADNVVETPAFIDPVRCGTSIHFEICLDGSGRDNAMNYSASSATENGKDKSDILHQMRIQNGLWQSLAYQLYPTFYYLPLDMTVEDHERTTTLTTTESSEIYGQSKLPAGKSDVDVEIVNATGKLPAGQEQRPAAEICTVASDEAVCLRYFLRVVITEKSGKKLWETVELAFYYTPHQVVFQQKSTITNTSIPPFLAVLESDKLTEKNENV